ncbi:dolichyl-diphosphooligosaccharide--protein glycosyltransferase subunit Swp1p [Trichomonascus vanleenenianus]|uniref:dolichyl-diphosphooligosaccharide-protein glycotransferase n=1 Tax=Trichomonascus vanleenenianus TaxID=2268995 RepID=UPI003ECA12D2
MLALASLARADWAINNGKISVVAQGKSLNEQPLDSVAGDLFVPGHGALELAFTTKSDHSGNRAHQTMAVLRDPESGLHFAFPASDVKPSGKAKVVVPFKAVPEALKAASKLELEILVASFGDKDKPLKQVVSRSVTFERPEHELKRPSRLESKPLIHHQFRSDPKRVAAPVSLAFAAGSLGLLVAIIGYMLAVGGLGGASEALRNAPLSHIGFVSSIVAYEVVFVLYFRGMSIFDTLARLAGITPVALLSGSRALKEIETRRTQGRFT